MTGYPAAQATILSDVTARVEALAGATLRLVAAASPNPCGDTNAVAAVAATILREMIPGVEIAFHPGSVEVCNLVARVYGSRPGRRLVLNGHLDTYPLGDPAGWTADPAGERRDGRLYGRGAADMKGGIAASIVAMAALAAHPELWGGEAVLTLAGDEESMGVLGTRHLIETVPHAVGDAAIIGDAGSARVLRFGEKGFLWVELEATGRASHGAHVHLGVNAITRLRGALDALSGLSALPVAPPPEVTAAIQAAQPVSEPLSGPGEADVLSSVTVNIGWIEGGTSLNLVPARARASADMRLPVGLSTAAAEAALAAALAPHEGVSWRILRRVEPGFTDPGAEIVQACRSAAEAVLGVPPAVNMRVGASDARLYRAAGIPTVVYGPTPYGMGGPDEYVVLAELLQIAQVHALTGLLFLQAE
jgi:acetylornithine deacetylase/succinyl-diaminopimelate desuccinylase-like protein